MTPSNQNDYLRLLSVLKGYDWLKMWELQIDNLLAVVEDISKSERRWDGLIEKSGGGNVKLDEKQKGVFATAILAIQSRCADVHLPVTVEAIRDTLSRFDGPGSITLHDTKQKITAIKDILRFEARVQLVLHIDQKKADFFCSPNIFVRLWPINLRTPLTIFPKPESVSL